MTSCSPATSNSLDNKMQDDFMLPSNLLEDKMQDDFMLSSDSLDNKMQDDVMLQATRLPTKRTSVTTIFFKASKKCTSTVLRHSPAPNSS